VFLRKLEKGVRKQLEGEKKRGAFKNARPGNGLDKVGTKTSYPMQTKKEKRGNSDWETITENLCTARGESENGGFGGRAVENGANGEYRE